ncbi:hypothetical protein [Rothia sp. ZJ932]|uniref:hypothetical protein n=1 Tax=Rothia sp. ZJ932 TaxID=2810516 RepID=UPI001967ED66|nr:hypothetical protein [Rothia sp. ZJ932]QRZ61362.1 hypothetical protein JR346_09045 [Rothia sp. ZJ932]
MTNSQQTHEESGTALARITLSGATITANSAEAEALGKFITHIAEAARALSHAMSEDRYEDSRDAHGRATKRKVKTQPILLEGIEAGKQLSLVFRAPQPLPQQQLTGGVEEHLPLEELAENTIESEALRTVFATFSRASASDAIDTEELLEPLETPTVREAVRRAVAVLHHQGWQVRGSIEQKNRVREDVKLNARGLARLEDALKADLIGKYRAQLRGTIDGHKNSNNTIYFRPKNAAQSWSTVAATDVIFAEAARISLDVQNTVDITVEFEPKPDKHGNPTERVVKRIVSIDKVYPSKGEPLF